MSIRKRTDGEYSAHLQGTLDLLILRTLIFGKQHGQGIARAIQTQSDNVLIVEHGSLYPALQRLEERGFIDASWGTSENNRKARFYTLTRTGRKELDAGTGRLAARGLGHHARARAGVGDGLESVPVHGAIFLYLSKSLTAESAEHAEPDEFLCRYSAFSAV